jgi:hypothetical protein
MEHLRWVIAELEVDAREAVEAERKGHQSYRVGTKQCRGHHDGCAMQPGRLGEPSFLWHLLFISTSYIILQLGGWFFEFMELSCVFGTAKFDVCIFRCKEKAPL